MGMSMKFDDYSPEAIEQVITNRFQERYGAEVEYVNAAYDISGFYQLMEKQYTLQKQQALVRSYCAAQNMDEASYQQKVDAGDVFADFPKKGILCCKKTLDPKEIEEELKEVAEKIQEL